jgi:release factor glutamine methyltransferase
MTPPSPTRLGDILRVATDYLAGRGVYQPRQACETLASRLLGCKRLELYIRFDTDLSADRVAAMRRGVKRLAAGEPVQYIIGETEFHGHVFRADKRALIPRPETELLVDTVLQCERLWANDNPTILDLGTGNGCIAVSLALAKPGATYIAADASPGALQLAAENARKLGVNTIRFTCHDLAESVEPDSVDAVVANLPYVPTGDWEKLPVHIRDHEPRAALDGGTDGMTIMRDAVPDSWIVLKAGGLLFLEIGADQGNVVVSLCADSGFDEAKITKDLAGHDRIVSAVKQEA